MSETVDVEDGTERGRWVSPIFGDVVAKMTLAIDEEVARRYRLGLPVIVDRGNGIEDLNA